MYSGCIRGVESNLKRQILLALALVALLSWAANPVQGNYQQVILVLWHGAALSELADIAPHMPQAWALMNTRAGGGLGAEGAYLSISTGSRAVGVRGAGEVFNREEDERYTLFTGFEPSALVQPAIWPITSGQNVNYTVVPGALGTVLREQGLTAAAYGNSDTNNHVRWAGTIAADQKGQVQEGDVSQNFLMQDAARPFGIRTDYDLLLQAVLGSSADLIVVDLGDPYRLDEVSSQMHPLQYERLREEVAEEARDFISQLLQELPNTTAVLVSAPHPGQVKSSLGQWIAPIVLFGGDTGLLTSPTTKWPGIVTNMDIAPTIITLLGADVPEFMIGAPISNIPHSAGAAIQEVQELEDRLLVLHQNRGIVLRALVGIQIGVYLISLALMVVRVKAALKAARVMQMILAASLALPLYLLVLSQGIWTVLLLTVLLVIILWKTRDFLWVVAGTGLATVFLIGADIIGGSWLIRFSYLGYDPIGGARFYGLGNEYMGIFVGAAIMGTAISAQLLGLGRRQTIAAALPVFFAVLVLVAAPWWGTNVGGAITAVLGFGVTLGAWGRVKFSWRAVLVLAVSTGLLLGTLMLIDDLRAPAEQSHIGRTVQAIRSEGAAAVYNIIYRKLAMNLRLIRYSIWSRAWIAALALIGASFIWPSQFITWLGKKYPQIASGIWGTVVAGLAALAFNDSGVVAAATCMFSAATTLAVLALEYRLLKHNLLTPQANIQNDTDGH